jgi:hypothetical protein
LRVFGAEKVGSGYLYASIPTRKSISGLIAKVRFNVLWLTK